MALAKYPKFGAQGGFVRTSYTNRSDQAELQVGRHTEVLVRSTTKECSATRSDCSWGVEPDGTGVNQVILDAIRLSIEDEPDINYTAAQTGEVDPDLPLLKAKCCVIRRGRLTLTVEGKGDPGYTLGATTMVTNKKAAIGTLDLSPIVDALETGGAVFRIINYTVNDTDQDWQKFTVEYQSYVDADEDGNSVALPYVLDENSLGYGSVQPPACTCPDANCCDSYRVEFSLNGNGYAEITATVTKNPQIPSAY
jgi:hypothetical protein